MLRKIFPFSVLIWFTPDSDIFFLQCNTFYFIRITLVVNKIRIKPFIYPKNNLSQGFQNCFSQKSFNSHFRYIKAHVSLASSYCLRCLDNPSGTFTALSSTTQLKSGEHSNQTCYKNRTHKHAYDQLNIQLKISLFSGNSLWGITSHCEQGWQNWALSNEHLFN